MKVEAKKACHLTSSYGAFMAMSQGHNATASRKSDQKKRHKKFWCKRNRSTQMTNQNEERAHRNFARLSKN